jgi:hypothetical protein
MGFVVNREELAWCAGFFDGEGHVSAKRHGIALSVNQIHPEVIERFKDAVGKRRPVYKFVAGSFHDVQAICAMLWPWLGSVKREQFKRALEVSSPKGWKTARCRAAGHEVQSKVYNRKGKDWTVHECRTCLYARRKGRLDAVRW